MNYIFIDTETGKYGILHSREKVSNATNEELKANTLENVFQRETKSRPIQKTYINDRFIVIPVPVLDIIYEDKKIIENISLKGCQKRR